MRGDAAQKSATRRNNVPHARHRSATALPERGAVAPRSRPWETEGRKASPSPRASLRSAANTVADYVPDSLRTLLSFVWQLLRETVCAPALWLVGWLYQYPADVQFKRTTQRYLNVLNSTEFYRTYLPTAKLLDGHLGIEEWQLQAPSPAICNAEGLVFDAQVALSLASSANPIAMGNFLTGMLLRNAHGMTNPELFPYATGTKACVEDYCSVMRILIGVFGGSKQPSSADLLRIRPCYDRSSARSAGEAAVNLTEVTSTLANPKPMNRHTSGAAEAAAEMRTRHSPRRRGHRSLGRVPSPAQEAVDKHHHRHGEGPRWTSRKPSVGTLKTALRADEDPTLVPSEEDDGLGASVSSPSSHDTSPHHVIRSTGTTPPPFGTHPHLLLHCSFSHVMVSATSSEDIQPSSSEMVSGTGKALAPSALDLPTESSFMQNMVWWAKTHAWREGRAAGTEGMGSEGRGAGAIIVPFDMAPRQRLAVLKDVLRAYGRTALILSGGASMGTYHTGVVRALYEASVLPDIISGSSAGSIIAAIICTKAPKELKRFVEVDLLSTEILRLTPFGRETSLTDKLRRLFKTGFLMDVRTLMECIRGQCGDMTFQEAYNISGRVLNISVTRDNQQGTHFDRHVLLNYLTAPHVVIWSAVSASSALPGLFTAVQLIEKAPDTGYFQPYLPGELYCDGSVAQDVPRDRLAQLFNVNYFIVSQVNPYVIPFLHPASTTQSEAKLQATTTTKFVDLVAARRISTLGKLWYGCAAALSHILLKCFYSGLLPTTGRLEVPYMLLTQSYCGNVTILPIGDITSALPDYLNMASNPTAEYISYVATRAQVRTWPLVARIKTATCIERALLKEIAAIEKALRKA